MLLDKKANVNVQGGEYDNALQNVSVRGHEKMVQMLQKRQRLTTLRNTILETDNSDQLWTSLIKQRLYSKENKNEHVCS